MTRALHILCVAAVACGGFALGGWLSKRYEATSRSAVSAAVVETSAAPTSELTSAFVSEAEAASAIFSAHLEKDRLRRGFELYQAFQRVDGRQLAALAERVLESPLEDRRGLLTVFLERWHDVDPEAAAKWVRPALERAFITMFNGRDEEIMRAWSAAAPRAAVTEAMNRPRTRSSEVLVDIAAATLSASDPGAAIEWIAEFPAGTLRDRAIAETLKAWAETDPAAAYAQIGRLPVGKEADQARREVLRKWARHDAPAALAGLREFVPDAHAGLHGNGLVNEVLYAAAERDGGAAVRWAATLPEDLRASATAAAVIGWAQKDPAAALEAARTQGVPLDAVTRRDGAPPFFNSGEQSLMEAALSADAPKAVGWLRQLPQSAERDRLLAAAVGYAPTGLGREIFPELSAEQQANTADLLARRIASVAPEEGMRWARELPGGNARSAAITGATSSYAHKLPSKIGALIDELPAGPDRDAALRGYASKLATEDNPKGLELATQIRSAEVREQTFRWIARGWLYRDEAAARAWLAQTPALSAATKANLLRERRESQHEHSR